MSSPIAGELVTRYDERLLSNTKISFMYTPGKIPVTFEVDGLRFGCALGMESHYPEIFIEYERLDVDCVLFSTTGATPAFASEVQGHAASNGYWVSFSALAYPGFLPLRHCRAERRVDGPMPGGCDALVRIVEVDDNPGDLARPWRRTARAGIYTPHLVEGDPRSDGRDMF